MWFSGPARPSERWRPSDSRRPNCRIARALSQRPRDAAPREPGGPQLTRQPSRAARLVGGCVIRRTPCKHLLAALFHFGVEVRALASFLCPVLEDECRHPSSRLAVIFAHPTIVLLAVIVRTPGAALFLTGVFDRDFRGHELRRRRLNGKAEDIGESPNQPSNTPYAARTLQTPDRTVDESTCPG